MFIFNNIFLLKDEVESTRALKVVVIVGIGVVVVVIEVMVAVVVGVVVVVAVVGSVISWLQGSYGFLMQKISNIFIFLEKNNLE